MNSNKFLIGSLIGGIVAFMAGGLLYAVIFGEMLAKLCPGMLAVQNDDMFPLVIGNFTIGILITYIFEKWANIRTWLSGATAGATIGALMALSFDSNMHGTTTLFTWEGVALDVVICAIQWGITGAVIGWWLGFKRA